jgi:trans-2-enoyl-CoA reductase
MLKPAEAFEVKSDALPPSLEWGQVLINVKAAPVGPNDIHPLFASAMDPGEC